MEGSKAEKKAFECARCGYKFSINMNNFSKAVCPWCGRKVEE